MFDLVRKDLGLVVENGESLNRISNQYRVKQSKLTKSSAVVSME
jgi:hypothetical protein